MNFRAMLPQMQQISPQQRGPGDPIHSRDAIFVPSEMGLLAAVSVALKTGRSIVVKSGDYELQAPLVVHGKLAVRGEGGPVRVLGTCVLGGAGGHVKGVSFVGQGDDAVRVESGTWSFHNCTMACTPSSARSCSALWVAGGQVSLFGCSIFGCGEATNGLVGCGDAKLHADMCQISEARFGAGAADSSLVELKGCEIFSNRAAFTAGPRPSGATLRVLDCNVHDNCRAWNDKFRPEVIAQRNTGF